MKDQKIRNLGSLRARERCPDCGRLITDRTFKRDGKDQEYGTLFKLTERCTICPWQRRVSNIRLTA